MNNFDFNKELRQIALAIECAREFEILPRRYVEVFGTPYSALELSTLATYGGRTFEEIVKDFTRQVLNE